MKAKSKKNSGDGYFRICEGSKVIIHSKGVYKEVDLYMRGKQIFVEHVKGKFVKLAANGATTEPSISWDEIIHEDYVITETAFGMEGEKVKS